MKNGAQLDVVHEDPLSAERYAEDTELRRSTNPPTSSPRFGGPETQPLASRRGFAGADQSYQSFLSDRSRQSSARLSPRHGSAVTPAHRSSSANTSGNPSSQSFLSASSSKKGRKVQFANSIKSIVVYEADNSMWVDVRFKRNKAGWVFAFLTVVVYFLWDFYLDKLSGDVNWDMLFVWAAICKLVYLIILTLCGAASEFNEFRLGLFKDLFTRRVGLPALGIGISFALHQFLRTLGRSLDRSNAPLYGPALSISLLFLPFLRILKGDVTYWVEWIPSTLVVLMSFIAAEPMFSVHEKSRATFEANAAQMASSMMMAISFLFVEQSQRVTDSVVIRLLPPIICSILWNSLYAYSRGSFDLDLAEFFSSSDFPHAVITALGSFSILVLTIVLVRHIDIQSLGAVFALKAIASPYLTCGILSSLCIRYRFWTPWLWGATAPLVILCVVIIFFASERRQVAVRKLAVAVEQKNRALEEEAENAE
jgi:hypothetical protein